MARPGPALVLHRDGMISVRMFHLAEAYSGVLPGVMSVDVNLAAREPGVVTVRFHINAFDFAGAEDEENDG